MISESKYLIVDIKNKLDRILYLQKNLKPNVVDGEPPKVDKMGDIIRFTHNLLDDISKNLK